MAFSNTGSIACRTYSSPLEVLGFKSFLICSQFSLASLWDWPMIRVPANDNYFQTTWFGTLLGSVHIFCLLIHCDCFRLSSGNTVRVCMVLLKLTGLNISLIRLPFSCNTALPYIQTGTGQIKFVPKFGGSWSLPSRLHQVFKLNFFFAQSKWKIVQFAEGTFINTFLCRPGIQLTLGSCIFDWVRCRDNYMSTNVPGSRLPELRLRLLFPRSSLRQRVLSGRHDGDAKNALWRVGIYFIRATE
jgi:hypothetical protein